jgi:hypothetical protein
MTGFEVDPTYWEAAIKGIASPLAKKAVDDIQSVWSGWVDKAGYLTDAARIKLEPIAKEYAANFYKRHGTLKVLSMSEPIPLDSVYVAVQVLNPDSLRYFESIDGLEDLFRQSQERNFQKKDSEKLPGLTVARDKPYLTVLGAPGGGKSTFLRKVGLEVIKGEKGEYKQPYIPVLLELKNFRNKEINLLEAIASEFKTCGLPRYEEWTLELLKTGKLLILLDGLDEVPTDQMSEMVVKIQDFVDLYDKNRFIVSCRTAAYRHNFRRFSDVAVANFDDEQIEDFIKNWFHSKLELAQDCWEKLKSSDYQAAKELAQTPVLLTLICVLYQRSGQFPTNRATLYERALRVLLEEWNAAKEIPQTQIYKGLDTKRKELLLSEIAYSGFVEDRLFFQKWDLAKQIEKLLAEMLPDEKLIDGHSVLRDIEVQHGILVERAESIYSFSHLTIQEFLTALYLYDDDAAAIVEQVVNDHLFDQRWREVFLLLFGLKNKGDALLLAMEKRIQKFVIENPKLQAILEWVEQVVDPNDGEIKSVGKRAIAIAVVNANSNAITVACTSIKTYDNYANAIAAINTHADLIAKVHDIAISIANNKTCDNPHSNVKDIVKSIVYAYDIVKTLTDTISKLNNYIDIAEENNIFSNFNILKVRSFLDGIQRIIPEEKANHKTRVAFRDQLLQTYREAFHLTSELVDLSKDELEQIEFYLYANKLLIDCRANAVRVRCWQDIESRMLLPVRPKP